MKSKLIERMIKNSLKEIEAKVTAKIIFKPRDLQNAVNLINDEVGLDPGYFFFKDSKDIRQFDSYWKNEKYKKALDFLASFGEIVNYSDLHNYIQNN